MATYILDQQMSVTLYPPDPQGDEPWFHTGTKYILTGHAFDGATIVPFSVNVIRVNGTELAATDVGALLLDAADQAFPEV